MTEKNPHPNEVTRRRIETFFPSPVPDKLLNAAIECKGGYILQEVRPHWKEPGEVTKSPYAKIVFTASTETWNIYWRRANGDWNLLAEMKAPLEQALEFIKSNPNGCFFG
jgi:hypothetical protein